jgi:hypothetical protein
MRVRGRGHGRCTETDDGEAFVRIATREHTFIELPPCALQSLRPKFVTFVVNQHDVASAVRTFARRERGSQRIFHRATIRRAGEPLRERVARDEDHIGLVEQRLFLHVLQARPLRGQFTVEAAEHLHQANDGLAQQAHATSRPDHPPLGVLQAMGDDLDADSGLA